MNKRIVVLVFVILLSSCSYEMDSKETIFDYIGERDSIQYIGIPVFDLPLSKGGGEIIMQLNEQEQGEILDILSSIDLDLFSSIEKQDVGFYSRIAIYDMDEQETIVMMGEKDQSSVLYIFADGEDVFCEVGPKEAIDLTSIHQIELAAYQDMSDELYSALITWEDQIPYRLMRVKSSIVCGIMDTYIDSESTFENELNDTVTIKLHDIDYCCNLESGCFTKTEGSDRSFGKIPEPWLQIFKLNLMN